MEKQKPHDDRNSKRNGRTVEHIGATMKDNVISMVELATALCAPPLNSGVCSSERTALRSLDIPPIRENLNEACNRRGRLALSTVEASVRMRLHDTECPERRAAFEDVLVDLGAIRKGFAT
jgi:hypothetical protein